MPINFAVNKNRIAKKFKSVSECNSCCQQLSILLQVLVTRPVVTAQSCCFGRVQEAFLLLFALKRATCQALTAEGLLRQVMTAGRWFGTSCKNFLSHDHERNECRSENNFT